MNLRTSACVAAAIALLMTPLFGEDPKPEPKPDSKGSASTAPIRARGERPGFWQGDESVSEETRQAIREAQRTFREETRPLNDQLREARRSLEELVFAEKIDPNAIKAKASEIGRL